MENYLLIGAVLVACLGAANDVRSARIPNWLTYGGLVAALVLRSALLGMSGLKSGAVGGVVAGGFFFVLFLLGGMGGGDVKLMAAVGAWVGSTQVVTMLIAAAFAGGLLALAYMIFGHLVRQTLRNVLELARFRLTSGLRPHPFLNVREPGSMRVPFGAAIAMGTLYCAGNAIWWR